MTMTLVSTVTVGAGGATSIDFTGIPQTGTDLLVVFSGRIDLGLVRYTFPITLNGSTSSFTNKQLYGTGSASGSGSGNRYIGTASGNSATSNTFGSCEIYITNYAGSTYKAISANGVSENNATEAEQDLFACLWSNTAAITSISLQGDGPNWAQYTTASLYTITKGSGGATVS